MLFLVAYGQINGLIPYTLDKYGINLTYPPGWTLKVKQGRFDVNVAEGLKLFDNKCPPAIFRGPELRLLQPVVHKTVQYLGISCRKSNPKKKKNDLRILNVPQ
jgi:hypothetical protein